MFTLLTALLLSSPWGIVDRCNRLGQLDLSGLGEAPTTVLATEVVARSGHLPAYCRVTGNVHPAVGFELRLPDATDWNGKLLMQGCGGSCGVIMIGQADDALMRGYAVVATDQGHRGPYLSSQWAWNNLAAEIDAAFRSSHVTVIAAKALLAAFYGEPQRYAYFRGCSNGGRRALRTAQTFPHDFDGIIGGAAPPDYDGTLNGLWNLRANTDADGNNILREPQLELLHDAALAACDLDDGLEDGIISRPLDCPFDPAALICGEKAGDNCLSDAQVMAAKLIYQGPRDSNGRALTVGGPPVGSELNWRRYINPPGVENVAKKRREAALAYTFFFEDPGPGFRFEDFDFDTHPEQSRTMRALFSADNPDLREFAAAGGKLMYYWGYQDPLPAESIIDYYHTVQRVMGGANGTEDFFRLFLIPGGNHCVGGPGASLVDYLSAMEAWVERDTAPDRLIGAKLKRPLEGHQYPLGSSLEIGLIHADPRRFRDAVAFTRPVVPYPRTICYSGRGDDTRAESFVVLHPEK